MCGIGGIIDYAGGRPVSEAELLAIRDSQIHRGPDDAGLWISPDGRVGLGHRRLSIVDLSPSGHQPMSAHDGRLQVVYNGEIYNYPALRKELEAAGHRFASTSDTEVLLHGYLEWGLGLLDRLRGMFAFALYDAARGETLLARDPLGIKPLYVADDGRRIAFASEVRALRRLSLDRGLDPEGLASYLLWGSIPAPRTLYRGIRALPPASWLRVRGGAVEGPTIYYRLEEELGHPGECTPDEAAEELRTALLDTARQHLLADVPVGAFLSGGVDSSALVGLMAEVHDAPILTVNLAFDVPNLDESSLASQAARLYGSEHHEIPIRIEEVRERVGEAVRCLDQPSIDGVNTYFVSDAAVRAGLKVAVSGVGGDELFGGYDTFTRIPRIRNLHDRLAAIPLGGSAMNALAGALDRLPPDPVRGKMSRALRHGGNAGGAYWADRGLFSPAEVRELLGPEARDAAAEIDPARELHDRVGAEDLPADEQVSALEFRQYLQSQLLRDTDAMGMCHSLEIRTPLVDRELLRAAARVPAALRRAGPAKRWLREAPRPPVPEALWKRRKQGFTLPFEHWLRTGGIPTTLPEHPWLRPSAVRRVAEDFSGGRRHWSRLWALLVLKEFLT